VVTKYRSILVTVLFLGFAGLSHLQADETTSVAKIDGSGPGWVSLGKADFAKVNSADDTWSFKGDEIHCTGKPVSVMRTQKQYTNFELVCEWRHMKDAGNSGIFVWTIPASLESLKGPGLPQGIEVQVLDLGYKDAFEQGGKRKADWFTCHGDVFPVGASKMKAFTPAIEYSDEDGAPYKVGQPKSTRSFPTQRLTHPHGEWNHYYVRAINGEVRLWVNGEEVNGGRDCQPATGYLALEAEAAPVQFRNLRIRELP